jgi:hypothetical protein
MNEFDRDNLDFFINTSQEEFDEWMDQASDLELNYAMTLIRTARRELTESELKLLDEIQDTSQAKELLKQFTLGK